VQGRTIFATRVPREDVSAIPETSFGAFREDEIVIKTPAGGSVVLHP